MVRFEIYLLAEVAAVYGSVWCKFVLKLFRFVKQLKCGAL